MDRPLPFEPLPADKAALRRRAVRDGLIISGWLCTAFALIVVSYFGRSLGYDGFSYWSIDLDDLYGRTVANNFGLGAFRYAPPVAYLFAPLGLLPWWLFVVLWGALMVGTTLWLGGRWGLVLLALPPVALELYHGNVHLLMAAAIALGFRHPWTWAFVILTKVTPGIGLLWFAVRREWRHLGIAIGVTAAISAVDGGCRPGPVARVDRLADLQPERAAVLQRPAARADSFADCRRVGRLGSSDRPPVDGRRSRHPGPADHLAARPVPGTRGGAISPTRRQSGPDAGLAGGRDAAFLRALRRGQRRYRARRRTHSGRPDSIPHRRGVARIGPVSPQGVTAYA